MKWQSNSRMESWLLMVDVGQAGDAPLGSGDIGRHDGVGYHHPGPDTSCFPIAASGAILVLLVVSAINNID